MTKLLNAFAILFVFANISFAANEAPTTDAPHTGHATNCHEDCKAQHPDVNSAEHKACMERCAQGDHK